METEDKEKISSNSIEEKEEDVPSLIEDSIFHFESVDGQPFPNIMQRYCTKKYMIGKSQSVVFRSKFEGIKFSDVYVIDVNNRIGEDLLIFQHLNG